MNIWVPIISFFSISGGSIIRIQGPRRLWTSAATLDLHPTLPFFSLLFPEYKMMLILINYQTITTMHVMGKTLRKKHYETLKKVKSYDDLNKVSQLSAADVKILLCCDHLPDETQQFSHRIRKQEILQKTRLFDPLKLFGMSHSQSVQQSARNNSAKLNSMFESGACSKNTSCSKKTHKKQTLIMGKTLNNYLRDNKENYQKNGVNNIQKMRIKLKIAKKAE